MSSYIDDRNSESCVSDDIRLSEFLVDTDTTFRLHRPRADEANCKLGLVLRVNGISFGFTPQNGSRFESYSDARGTCQATACVREGSCLWELVFGAGPVYLDTPPLKGNCPDTLVSRQIPQITQDVYESRYLARYRRKQASEFKWLKFHTIELELRKLQGVSPLTQPEHQAYAVEAKPSKTRHPSRQDAKRMGT